MDIATEQILKYLPMMIPLMLIQLGLMIFALVDLIKRQKTRGSKWIWMVLILFVNIIGPILYFLIGREEE